MSILYRNEQEIEMALVEKNARDASGTIINQCRMRNTHYSCMPEACLELVEDSRYLSIWMGHSNWQHLPSPEHLAEPVGVRGLSGIAVWVRGERLASTWVQYSVHMTEERPRMGIAGHTLSC